MDSGTRFLSGAKPKLKQKELRNRRKNLVEEIEELEASLKDADHFDSLEEESELDETKTPLLTSSSSTTDDLIKMMSKYEQLERCQIYLAYIRETTDLTSRLDARVKDEAWTDALRNLEKLKVIYDCTADSSCRHLCAFARARLTSSRTKLQSHLTKEFKKILKLLNWPIVSAPSSGATPSSVEKRKEFSLLVSLLLKTQDCRPSDDDDDGPDSQSPMSIFLMSLQKRFRYHFYGHLPTNQLEKARTVKTGNLPSVLAWLGTPEWYMTQVLNWLRMNRQIIEEYVQPSMPPGQTVAMMDFARGLVSLIAEKFSDSLPSILDDEALLGHAIDELVLFNGKFLSMSGLTANQCSCLDVLCREPLLSRWLAWEERRGLDYVSSLISSSTGWDETRCQISEISDFKLPQFVDDFITYILAMPTRYSFLPDMTCQSKFLRAQGSLLEKFCDCLSELASPMTSEPLTSKFFLLCNACTYLLLLIQQWAEEPFYLQLWEQKSRDDSGAEEDSLGVFGKAAASLSELKGKVEEAVIRTIVKEVEAHYSTSWIFSGSHSEDERASAVVIYVRQTVLLLKADLAESVFRTLLQETSKNVDKIVFERTFVVVKTQLTEDVFARLGDVLDNFFLVFSDLGLKPHVCLKKLKCAWEIMQLTEAEADSSWPVYSPKEGADTAVAKMKSLQRLTPLETVSVLRRRPDFHSIVALVKNTALNSSLAYFQLGDY